jgi:alkylation response protein AidB-like acyl-CoA dehydrogenase
MACLAVEEFGRVDGSCSVLIDVQNTLVTNAILKWATDAQKDKYLPKLAREWVGAYALSESSSGSDAFALKLRAEEKGDRFVLKGHKLWITNGAEANFFIVFANMDPAKGYKGITAFIVERGFKGFTVGKKEDKMGIRASSTCELLFEDCEVPKENVLGEVGKGYKIAIETLNEGRIGIGAQMVGIAQGAYEAALSYVRTREQFGKTLAQFQGVQFQLAEMRVDVEAARVLVYNAARLKDAGKPFIEEAAIAKYFSSKASERVSSMAIDLFGGNGFTKDYPVEKFYRDAKIGQIYEGTSNMQLQTIAKMELEKGV